MSFFTLSPEVTLLLITSTLLVLLLVACWPNMGENILRFCSGLLDLYQRLRRPLQPTLSVLPEENMVQSVAPLSSNQQEDRVIP